jgi:hypothetical protein
MKKFKVDTMTAQVQEMLQSFDRLPENEKRELVAELLRRSVTLDAPPLTDEQLLHAAEEVFLQLDRDE